MTRRQKQPPVDQPATTLEDVMWIFKHPAFWLGFNDAMAGLPFNHDTIIDRIRREAPRSVVAIVSMEDFSLAQFRYEEGRLLHFDCGVRCEGWIDPLSPPDTLIDFARAWVNG